MIWEPSREFIERTNVWRFMQRLGFADREAFLRFSREEPERFWDEILREMNVEWFEPYTRVLDASRGPEWAQWFIGGKLNIAHNCLNRWAATDRIACLWEGESGETRTVTFAELQSEANRVANALTAIGDRAGDRVALAMPMVPEILSILYGCFQIGATVVPIFAGFGSGAIATRLEDSGARVLFTADHLERRGKALPAAGEGARAIARDRRTRSRIALPRLADIGGHTTWEDFLAEPTRVCAHRRARFRSARVHPLYFRHHRQAERHGAYPRRVPGADGQGDLARRSITATTTASSGSPTSAG